MDRVMDLVKLYFYYAEKSPCKKTVQKINYLIQEATNIILYDYSIHFYGPYSAELDLDMQYLYKRGDLDIQYTNFGHLLTIGDIAYKPNMDIKSEKIVEYFSSKNPSQLELLATTLYVQREMKSADVSAITIGVLKIKGRKYNKNEIYIAIYELKDLNYF